MTDSMPRNRRTAAFERRVARALDAATVGPAGGPLVVACSGGPDSTAALVAVARAASRVERPVVATCFDHRLRPRVETEADAAFVRELAACLEIDFRSGAARGRPQPSEAGAREARYRWLARTAKEVGATEVVTGHTLDDQAETVLLRLVRGAGLRGLAGMTIRAAWPVRGGSGLSVLRPLLDVSRADVEAYLNTVGLQARHDASNEDLGYARNRLRQRVLPELRHLNPRAVEAITRAALAAGRDDAALEAWARAEAARLVKPDGRRGLTIDRAELRVLPPAVALRLLRGVADRLGVRVDAAHLDAMWAASSRRGRHVTLSGAEFLVETDVGRLRRI
ncbi:MAG: tRNA lysidine(34) synthetase TilS [Dehalococcoidia bacterium]